MYPQEGIHTHIYIHVLNINVSVLFHLSEETAYLGQVRHP